MLINKKIRGVVILSTLFLIGCGGGSGTTEPGYSGRLVDDVVAGVYFECGNVSGKTNKDGIFGVCPSGSVTTFKIGNLVLGSLTGNLATARANNAVHILDMLDKDNAVKVATLLQSLDKTSGDNAIVLPDNIDEIINQELGNTNNTINIKELTIDKIEILSANVAGEIGTNPVTPEEALDHLEETIKTINKLPPVEVVTTGGES